MTDHTTCPSSKVDVGTLPDLSVMEDAGPERIHNIIVGVFVFKSGHRDQIACSLLGGFSKPRTAATQSLDSGLCSMLI